MPDSMLSMLNTINSVFTDLVIYQILVVSGIEEWSLMLAGCSAWLLDIIPILPDCFNFRLRLNIHAINQLI